MGSDATLSMGQAQQHLLAFQLLLTAFLFLLFWFLHARFRKLIFFYYWTLAWIALFGFLAVAVVRLSAGDKGWASGLVPIALAAGFLQIAYLFLGARALQNPTLEKRTVRWGIVVALAAAGFNSLLLWTFPQPAARPLESVFRQGGLLLVYAYSARVLLWYWRRNRTSASLITGFACVVLGGSSLFAAFWGLHGRVAHIPFAMNFVDVGGELTIALGMILLGLDEYRSLGPDKIEQIGRLLEERKWEEQARQEAEARYRTLVEQLASVSYIAEPGVNGKWFFVSPQVEGLLGFPPAEWLADSGLWIRQVHPLDRELVAAVEKTAMAGKPFEMEYRIYTRDEKVVWVHDSGVLMPGTSGGPGLVHGVLLDVTERKHAELLQSALYRIAEKASSAEDLQQLYASIHAILGELMYAKNCYVALHDAATDMVSFPYFVDEKDPSFPPHKFRKGLTEYVIKSGQPLLATADVLDDLARRGEVERAGGRSQDWMGMPLKEGETTFGVLVLQSYEPHVHYGEAEKEILTFVSRQISNAVVHKRNQDAIRQSESKFRAVAETAATLIFTYDGSRFPYVNPAAETVTGYTRQELQSMAPFALVRSDYRAMMQERSHKRLLGESAPSRYEIPILAKSGEERWLDLNASIIEFEGTVATLCTALDITERKRAEQLQSALYRISEQAAVAEDLPQLFASLHAIVGELMYARNFYIALYDAATGILSFPYFVDEEDPTPAPKKLGKGLTEHVLRTGEPLLASPEIFEELVRQGEAETIGAPSVDWLGVPLKFGNTTFGALVVQSYSQNVRFNTKQKEILTFVSQHVATAIERKRSAEALRHSEARYRKQVQDAVYGIYRASTDDRFLEVNPALVAMLGYDSAEELLALKLSRDVYLHPVEQDRLIRSYRHNGRVENVETRWKKKEGTPIDVRLSGRAVFNDQGEVESFEAIAEDVTERRSLEQQLRQSQKMEAVGRLAGGVAHDFNNLLTVIRGYSELMLEKTPAGGPLRAEMEQVRKATDRAASLTSQLLAFSRKAILSPRVIDLNDIVMNLDTMLRRLIGEDVELSIVFDKRLDQVRADPGQIEQLIMNLAVNARDAMPKGGKLTLETMNVDLDEGYAREHSGVKPGRYVMLAVSDNGVGMDEETRSHLFEPFFTTKETGKGTGLGLPTVYGIVKQSGGYIWVYSEPGLGTTFKVYLPRVDGPVEERHKLSAPLPTHLGTETILLVEDEDGVRSLVQEVLTRQGYTVIETRHGQEALEACERHAGPIPLLLTDVVLPQMSGRELAERLKILHPDMRVLYMSGYTADAILRHGVIDQETAFLQKPFNTEDLARKVREVLDNGAT